MLRPFCLTFTFYNENIYLLFYMRYVYCIIQNVQANINNICFLYGHICLHSLAANLGAREPEDS
jgi:hypothetical protein